MTAALIIGGALTVTAFVLLFAIVATLHSWNRQMALDFTGIQSSLSTLGETVAAVSTEVSSLVIGSDTAADQSTIDSVKSSLDGINTTLASLVPSVSTVSTAG